METSLHPACRTVCGVLVALACLVAPAQAQNFPVKPLRMLVGFAAGGSIDATGRYYAQRVSAPLGQTVVVENRPGAAAQLAVQQLIAAAPDGYNILLMTAGTTIASAKAQPPFDVRHDIRPVAGLVAGPLAFYVNPALPVRTLGEFIAYAKARPGQLNYASSGMGSLQNLIFELLSQRVGMQLVHVPFKGSGDSVTAVIGNQIHIGMDTLSITRGQADGGKLRLLALTTARSFDGVPGMTEAGISAFDFPSWSGIGAPARTPKNVVDALNAAFNAVSNDAESKAHFAKLSQYTLSGPPEDFGRVLANETEVWSKLIQSLNMKFE